MQLGLDFHELALEVLPCDLVVFVLLVVVVVVRSYRWRLLVSHERGDGRNLRASPLPFYCCEAARRLCRALLFEEG